MGFFVELINCFPNKSSTNVMKSFILDAVGFVFCLILLLLQPEKTGNSKSLKSFKKEVKNEKVYFFNVSFEPNTRFF